MSARKPIGRSLSLAGSELVYQTADGFEIRRSDHYRTEELRVFYDDVMLVTIHREVGALYVTFTSLVSLFFLTFAAIFLLVDDDTWPAAVMFAGLAAPFVIALLLRLLLKMDVITIFGRRSTARMRFGFRKQRAREVYGQVCAAVRQAQRRREPEPVPEESAHRDVGDGAVGDAAGVPDANPEA
jgi:hypothetical protein